MNELKSSLKKKNNSVEGLLNRIKVKRSDTFLINIGLVHVIWLGLVITKMKQNLDY